jgi:hypothetical protein
LAPEREEFSSSGLQIRNVPCAMAEAQVLLGSPEAQSDTEMLPAQKNPPSGKQSRFKILSNNAK